MIIHVKSLAFFKSIRPWVFSQEVVMKNLWFHKNCFKMNFIALCKLFVKTAILQTNPAWQLLVALVISFTFNSQSLLLFLTWSIILSAKLHFKCLWQPSAGGQLYWNQKCSPVNLLHIFRTPFLRNTTGGLLLFLLFELSRNKLSWKQTFLRPFMEGILTPVYGLQ